MKKLYLLLITGTIASNVFSQSPNFSEHIAPIIYNHCTTCHRDGSIAPFPLQTYYDVLDKAFEIREQVNNRTMPPWPPNPNYTHLAHERLLSGEEINAINDWVEGEFERGDSMLAPQLPVFPNGSILGTPDLQVQIPDYYITSNKDVFRCFVIPSVLTETRFISGFELLPGNRQIVHHVLVFWDTTGTCQQKDDDDPLPGYTSAGGVGTNSAKLIGAWVPGSTPFPLPDGFGIRIPKNADIVMQFHYSPESDGQMDNSRFNLIFTPLGLPVRSVSMDPILNHFLPFVISPYPLVIPANEVKTFTESFTIPNFDASVLSVAPHMHLVGTSIKSWGVTPAMDTIPFIDIPDWNFHWQGAYSFRKVLKIPAGTKLQAAATYDNTSDNEENPNTPPKTVTVGENTTNEMMLVYFAWTPYQPGDENIVIDSSAIVKTQTSVTESTPDIALINAYPNPASDEVIIEFNIPRTGNYSLDAMDMMGRKVRSFFVNKNMEKGYQRFMYSTSGLSSGTYFVNINGKGAKATTRLVVVKN